MEKNKAIDPVCGMEVDTKSEFHAVHQGQTFYFCSQADRIEFQKHPEKYMLKEPQKEMSGSHTRW